MDWYEKYIEEPIRPLVKLLRDNGINTTCSCGHEMWAECEYHGDPSVTEVYNLLFNNGYRHYKVEVVMGFDQLGLRLSDMKISILKPD